MKSTTAGIVKNSYGRVSGIRCDGNTAKDIMPDNGYIHGKII